MKKVNFVAMLTFIVLGSCASISGYKYYIVDPVGGKLLGGSPSEDLPLIETCSPDGIDKAKCIAMLREEYFKMDKELVLLRQELKDCEAGH